MWDLAYLSQEISIQLFFSPTFSFLFIIVPFILVLFVLFLLAIISLSLFVFFFCVFFEFSYQYIDDIFNTGESSSSYIFLTHRFCLCHISDVRPFAWLLVFLFSGPICWSYFLVHFKNNPRYLTRRTAEVFNPFMIFLLKTIRNPTVLSSFLVLLKYS